VDERAAREADALEEGRMPLINLLITIVVLGVLLFVFDRLPLDVAIKQILRVLVIVVIVLIILAWLLPGLAIWRPPMR